MIRDFFHIGGGYVHEPAFESDIYSEQMYVEELAPVSGVRHTHPIILINAGVVSSLEIDSR